MVKTAICLGLLGSALGLELVPPPNIWVRESQSNVTLLCRASEKIRSCSWTTPYGEQYPLQPDLFAEGGRLMHYANDKDVECGILITTLEAKDNGRWKCNIGVVANSEVLTASGIANITIATPPSDVYLETPHDMLNSNFTHGGINKVKCTAKNSRPAPTFHWMVDEDVLRHDTENIFDEAEKVFTQILNFIPSLDHANRTLKCIVEHPGMTQNISTNTEIKISGESKVQVAGHLGFGEMMTIILAALALLIISALAFVARRKYFQQNADIEKPAVDEEKGDTETKTDEKPDSNGDVKEEDNADKTVEEKRGLELRSKVVQILASLKPNKDKKMTAGDEAATEFEKVELNDGEEKKDEEKEDQVDETTKQSFGTKVASFLAKFRSSPVVKEEIIVEVTDAPKEDVELDPENTEEKVPERRRGSETPV